MSRLAAFGLSVLAMSFAALGCQRAPSGAAPAASQTKPETSPATGASTATPAPVQSEAPKAAEVPGNVPAKIDGATLGMDESTVDGLKMEKISCKGGGGLFGGVALLGAFAKQKDALQACASTPEVVRVHVAFDPKTTDDVRVAASSPAIASCVAAAVSKATFGSSGACVLSIHIGK